MALAIRRLRFHLEADHARSGGRAGLIHRPAPCASARVGHGCAGQFGKALQERLRAAAAHWCCGRHLGRDDYAVAFAVGRDGCGIDRRIRDGRRRAEARRIDIRGGE